MEKDLKDSEMQVGTILSKQLRHKENVCQYCGDKYYTQWKDYGCLCDKEECHSKHFVIDANCGNCKKEIIVDTRNYAFAIDNMYFCSHDCLAIAEKERKLYNLKTQAMERIRFINKDKGLPKKLTRITSDKTEILRNFKQPMFITGDVGTGKTVLLATLCKIYNSKNENTVWINYNQFLLDLYASFNTKKPFSKECAIYNKTQDGRVYDPNKAPVLFIDDIGAEKLSDYARSMLYNIINFYDENEYKIFITSNLTLKEISERIDERIASRIAGMCKVVSLKGKDRRL